ncbi:MAG TPA: hypothetical protein VIQ30_05165 [Pseudonocardia sp.]
MDDDTYCLFVILTCMTTLAVPDKGQVIVAVFGVAIAVLAHLAAQPGDTDQPGHPDYREVKPRPHAG